MKQLTQLPKCIHETIENDADEIISDLRRWNIAFVHKSIAPIITSMSMK